MRRKQIDPKELENMWEEMWQMVKDSGVTIITAKEPTHRRKHRTPPPESFTGPNIIIVDYIGRLGEVS